MEYIWPIPSTTIADFSYSSDFETEVISTRTCDSLLNFIESWENYRLLEYTVLPADAPGTLRMGFVAYIEFKELGVTFGEFVDIRISTVKYSLPHFRARFEQLRNIKVSP